ncbi:hypothetical protein Mal4_38080 [Maioricimonas rarisocia]|uniref:Uncharacterized protein n=1 Tax=Maioricimonas rarisocia TaxID=2528026 RepID=A0A517ZAE1_9PLAN|nr:hypothetical protein Mal4_38080 [Maioricimonas rarisocia]
MNVERRSHCWTKPAVEPMEPPEPFQMATASIFIGGTEGVCGVGRPGTERRDVKGVVLKRATMNIAGSLRWGRLGLVPASPSFLFADPGVAGEQAVCAASCPWAT